MWEHAVVHNLPEGKKRIHAAFLIRAAYGILNSCTVEYFIQKKYTI